MKEMGQRKAFLLEGTRPVEPIYISIIHSIKSIAKRGTYQRITMQSLGPYRRKCRKRRREESSK